MTTLRILPLRSFMWQYVFSLHYHGRVQRKSFLQLAIWASWSQHLLAQTSFQLAPEAFRRAELISHFFCHSNSSRNITCPSGKLKIDFTSPIAKSTRPGLSDTTFFVHCILLEVKVGEDAICALNPSAMKNHYLCTIFSYRLKLSRSAPWPTEHEREDNPLYS